jgi:hypothetical protein
MKRLKALAAAGSILWMVLLFVGPAPASDNTAGVILKSTPDQFDAGKVAEGKTVEVTTSVQNVGDSPVEITNVRTS